MLPFPGGIAASLNGALIFSAGAAVIYGLLCNQPQSTARTVSKVLSTVLLTYIAWAAGGPWLLVATLAFSVLGDYFLARGSDNHFIRGLGSFLAAQIGYFVLFLPIGRGAALPLDVPAAVIMVLGVIIFCAAVASQLVPELPPRMKVPVIVYIVAILSMGVAAAAFNSLTIFAGAVLFLVSDATIAIERFMMEPDSPSHAWTGPFIWVTYYLAQVLLLFGVLAIPR